MEVDWHRLDLAKNKKSYEEKEERIARPYTHKKINQEKLRFNQETRFISDISQDLTEIFSNQYFMKLTWSNLS